MRRLILAACLALTAAPAFAKDPVEGEWLVPSGGAKVRIAPCAGNPQRMCGLLSWFKDPADAAAFDTKNPDPAQRSRKLLGLPMIRDFTRDAPGRWSGGKIYDPGAGKTYDSKIGLNPDGTLKVEGCVLMICKAQTWRRS